MAGQSKPQLDKFKDFARELEADKDEAAFEGAVKKIARAPKSVGEQTEEKV